MSLCNLILITYYLPSGSANVTVMAHVKVGGTPVESIQLYDDGAHDDGVANDLYYANMWDSSGVLGNSDSGLVPTTLLDVMKGINLSLIKSVLALKSYVHSKVLPR